MEAYHIPFKLVFKNNWGTRWKWWGEMEPDCSCVGSMSLLNMALVCIHVGLGTSHFIIFSCMGLGNLLWLLIFSLARHHNLRSFDVKHFQIKCRATDMFKRSLPLQFFNLPLILCWSWFTNIIFLYLVSMMCETLWPSFDQVTSYRLQLIIQEVDLETPF